MKLYRNLADGIVEGVQEVLGNRRALRPTLKNILIKNRKWGSNDRKLVGKGIIEIIRWKRKFDVIGKLNVKSKNYYKNLLVVWSIYNDIEFEECFTFSELKKDNICNNILITNSKRTFKNSIPDWLDSLGMKTYGKVIWEKEIQALNKPAKLFLRTNTLKTDVKKLQAYLKENHKVNTNKVSNIPNALVVEENMILTHLDIYKKGWFEIQDLNSQKISIFTNPKPNMLIIDTCAGSGGKTLHLATIMRNKGRIIATDSSDRKRKQLENRLKRNGISIVEYLNSENKDLLKKYYNSANIVIIDAPCSGLGVLKRNPAAKWHMNPSRIRQLVGIQKQILQEYATLVKSGGNLIYATCTIFPNENQNQIKNFLKSKIGLEFNLEKQEVLLSQNTDGDGFYMAKLLKS